MSYEAVAQNINKFRKAKGMTQEALADKLGVSAQAVSKWENGQSCPDIAFLPQLAEFFGVSIDELFAHESTRDVVFVPEGQRKSMDEMFLRVRVHSGDGDKIQVNLPAPLFKILSESGAISFGGDKMADLSMVDFDKIFMLMDQGAMGKLVEVESADGDIIEVYVE